MPSTASTLVLLHFPTAYSAPVGIWWWNPSMQAPNSYYVTGAENYYAMVVGLLGSSPNEEAWDSLIQKFADRTPFADAFEADTINVSPKTYLRALRNRKPATSA